MNENHRISAVILDLDGLMIDTERYSFRVLKEYAAEFGIVITRDDYKRLIGQDSKSAGIFLHEQMGIPLTPQQIMDEHWARLTEVISEQARPMPGLDKLIKAFQSRRLPLAVASNSRLRYIEYALEAIKVRDIFQCVVSAQELGRSKPAPDVYLQAAACLGVPPESCLALEDSPPGLQSALAAGMRVVAVPNRDLTNENFNGAFARFHNLEEVLKNIDHLLI